MPEVKNPPVGAYPHPAAATHIDLDERSDLMLRELPAHGRRTLTLAKEGGVSLVMMAMESGDLIQEHSTPGTTTVQVLRGHTTISSGGSSIELRAGELVVFQPGVRHDLRAEEQTVVLLTIAGGTESEVLAPADGLRGPAG